MSDAKNKSNCQLYTYNTKEVELKNNLTTLNQESAFSSEEKIVWLNFHSLKNELIQHSFELFSVHRLIKEDIFNLNERPKIEESEGYLFVTFKSVVASSTKRLSFEQISFIMDNSNLISYQEKSRDHFSEIRERITEDKGIVRKKEVDYLLYLLLNAILQGYHQSLQKIIKRIDTLGDRVFKDHNSKMLEEIEELKSVLRDLKKVANPFKEQLSKLSSIETKFIKQSNKPYYNDLKDQVLFVLDEIENERQELETLTNFYFASVSQQANDVMKTLTVIASIFIPLTFIAGIYGMNFKNIPETEWTYGYLYFWGLMIGVSALMFYYFNKKKWF